MTIDPRTPVLVGAGFAHQRHENPADAVEAIELMALAAEAAATDAGSRRLLAATTLVSVTEGTWTYTDPGRLLAIRLGTADPTTTVMVDTGITQQQVIADAVRAIADGAAEVVLVVGGEARYRGLRAKVTGVDAPETAQPDGTAPDRHVVPHDLGISDLELVRNAVTPSTSYALIEQARRHHLGLDPAEHRRQLGDLYAGMAQVAAANPHAWDRQAYAAADLVDPSPTNRMIASPYTKLLCSQWNVDQAAALLLCSVEAAERFGIAPDRWVFPHTSAVSNHAVSVLQRPEIWRSPGSEVAAAVVLGDQRGDDLAHVDLYSCFPAAVQVQADALDLRPGQDVTVTGGMSLAGGPLNNYVLGAMVRLAERLRDDPDSFGLTSSVSVFLTKSGFGVWSTRPPSAPFHHEDVTDAAASIGAIEREIDGDYVGRATIASWTVDHQAGEPHRAVVFVDTPDGARTMASAGDPAICRAMLDGEWIGTGVDIRPDGSFVVPD